MKSTTRARLGVGIASATAFALVTSGCASSNEPEAGGPVTFTLATFNDFGYTDELLAEYEAANPNVTIEHNQRRDLERRAHQLLPRSSAPAAASPTSRPSRSTGSPSCMQYSDKLADLSDPAVEGRWLDWKTGAATDADGRLIGYGTDIGPEAICYRSDLFAAAGLPTDRDEVADAPRGRLGPLLRGRRRSTSPPPATAWFDSAGATYQGMINQVSNAYENEDGTIIATDNPEVEDDLQPGSRPRAPTCRRTSASGATTGSPLSRAATTPRCSAPAGCSVSSRATLRTPWAGTSPTSSPAAAATGAVRT